MKTLKEKIAVMQAHVDGENIEHYSCGEWFGASEPTWDWQSIDYRVKPKPRELFVVFGLNERFVQADPSSSNAANILRNVAKSGTIVKFIEVIE